MFISLQLTSRHWRCTVDKCKGRLATPLEYRECVPVEQGMHSHPPDPAKIEVRKVEERVKETAANTQDTPRTIVQNALGGVSPEIAERIGSATNLAATVRRKRKREDNLPRAPRNQEDLRIPPQYRRIDGEEFLKYDNEDFERRIIIFATNTMLALLVQSSHWMSDGTFKISPSLFFQIYTIHAIVRDNVIPCVYVLLPNKTRQTYREMWQELLHLEPRLSPRSIQIDFEASARSAIQDVFPNITVTGCFFHLGQAVYRKLVDQGLKEQYANDVSVRRFTKMLMALAFLPVDEVSEGIDDLREMDEYPAVLDGLFDYFEDTYIGRRYRRTRRPPLFAKTMWNVRLRTQEGLPRTNNQLEAWHGAFQGTFGGCHPSFFKFLETLKKEQKLQATNLIQVNQGRDLVKHLKKYQAINRRLRRLIEEPPNSQEDFLRGIAANLEINVV